MRRERFTVCWGRNGAGKTTLLNVIASRIFADGGAVTIDGENAVENMAVHDKLFCMSEQDLYSPALRVARSFQMDGALL